MYQINAFASWQTLNDTLYILDERNGKYYAFKSNVARIIWHGIEDKESFSEITNKISNLYSVDLTRVIQDCSRFINDLLSVQLISEVA